MRSEIQKKVYDRLKGVIPPPTRTFMREMDLLKKELLRQSEREKSLLSDLSKICTENKKLMDELKAAREENKKQLDAVCEESKKQLDFVREENKKQLDVIRRENRGQLEALREENRKLADVIRENQKKNLEMILKEIRDSSLNNYAPGHKIQNAVFLGSIPPERYPEELCKWYYQKTGYMLNLVNPRTYNEKIQWMKLYDATPLKTRLSDKYLVRDWVREKIGEEYLVPLLGVWDSFEEIDFDRLPDQFVLKANHGCGWNVIVKDKSQLDREDAKKKFDTWMRMNYAFNGLELQYLNIKPKIIAEQYLENDNDDLYDYKVFCFDGKPESVMYLSERKHGLKMAFFDLDWNKLPFVYTYPRNESEVPEPANLGLMIDLAKRLAEGFPHVRVDFYELNDGSIKFGEMTFTSADGTCRWNIPEQDLIYGNLITLPPKSPIPERTI